MSSFELDSILISINNNYKNVWEQTRFIAYIQASCFATKDLKPTDLIKFNWDTELTENQNNIISIEEIEIRKQAMLQSVISSLNLPNKEIFMPEI